MVQAGVGGGIGLITTALIASHNGWNGEIPPTVEVTKDGSFLSEWDAYNGDAPPCEFYNATYQFAKGLCTHFAIARMSASDQAEALDRANECASHHNTDCILSPEVGLSVPAAFVYDDAVGLKMIIAPKIMETQHETKATTVAFQMPDDGRRTGVQIEFNSSVSVQYLEGVSRQLSVSTFSGHAAYCIQMLRMAFADDCWQQID